MTPCNNLHESSFLLNISSPLWTELVWLQLPILILPIFSQISLPSMKLFTLKVTAQFPSWYECSIILFCTLLSSIYSTSLIPLFPFPVFKQVFLTKWHCYFCAVPANTLRDKTALAFSHLLRPAVMLWWAGSSLTITVIHQTWESNPHFTSSHPLTAQNSLDLVSFQVPCKDERELLSKVQETLVIVVKG